MGSRQFDLVGLRYNMLIVVEQLPSRVYGDKSNYHKKRMWLCKCDCGNMTEANTGSLTTNQKKSCGCLTSIKSAQNSINSRHKVAKEDAGYRSIYARYRANAKSRKMSFNIDFDNAISIMKSNCNYCGIEPSNLFWKSYYNVKYNGIDRVDNLIGYEKNNLVSCCKMCNIAKNNNSEKDFLDWIKRINKFQKIKK
jgi:hypothetical protein